MNKITNAWYKWLRKNTQDYSLGYQKYKGRIIDTSTKGKDYAKFKKNYEQKKRKK